MKKLSDFGNLEDTGDFYGNYAVEVKKAVVLALCAGLHIIVLGKPGTGKTEMVCAIMRSILGDEGKLWKFQRNDPTMGSADLKGMPDYKLALETGEYRLNPKGTISDRSFLVVVGDEFPRQGDHGFDVYLDKMDIKFDPSNFVVFALTANWLMKDERSEAVLDRIGVVVVAKSNGVDEKEAARKILSSQGRFMNIGSGLPDWDTIMEVRRAMPTQQSTIDTIGEFMTGFVEEVRKGLIGDDGTQKRDFGTINERRRRIFVLALYKMSVLTLGQVDFTAIPEQAKEMLKYLWISADEDEIADWVTFCSITGVDAARLLYDRLIYGCVVKMDELSRNQNRLIAHREVGTYMQTGLNEISNAFRQQGIPQETSDEYLAMAVEALGQAFSKFVNGQPIIDVSSAREEEVPF